MRSSIHLCQMSWARTLPKSHINISWISPKPSLHPTQSISKKNPNRTQITRTTIAEFSQPPFRENPNPPKSLVRNTHIFLYTPLEHQFFANPKRRYAIHLICFREYYNPRKSLSGGTQIPARGTKYAHILTLGHLNFTNVFMRVSKSPKGPNGGTRMHSGASLDESVHYFCL